jgi:hypothetical protein
MRPNPRSKTDEDVEKVEMKAIKADLEGITMEVKLEELEQSHIKAKVHENKKILSLMLHPRRTKTLGV